MLQSVMKTQVLHSLVRFFNMSLGRGGGGGGGLPRPSGPDQWLFGASQFFSIPTVRLSV